MLHSPDGIVFDNNYQPVEGLEVKNIRSDSEWKGLYGIPDPYYAQVQHGLLCSGLPKWNVLALVSGQKLITREVFPDPEFQERIIYECARFWTLHVRSLVPPAPDGTESAQRALDRTWEPSPTESEVPWDLVGELKAVDSELKVIEREKKRLQQLIEAHMGEAETATVDGVPVATWKEQVRRSIDVKALRVDDPKLASKYEKTTSSRVFRLK